MSPEFIATLAFTSAIGGLLGLVLVGTRIKAANPLSILKTLALNPISTLGAIVAILLLSLLATGFVEFNRMLDVNAEPYNDFAGGKH